jgi:hypothetical protein
MRREDAARINGAKGGRPPGSLNETTLKRRAVLQAVQERIMKQADTILNSQMMLARGYFILYRVEKYYEKVKDDKGKQRKILRAKPPKIVDSEWEITEYLQQRVDEFNDEENDTDEPVDIEHPKKRPDEEPDDDYYFIVVKPPDNKAIEGLKATAFGKAIQPIRFADDDDDDISDPASKEKSRKALRALLGKGNQHEGQTKKKAPAAVVRRRGAAHTGKRK